VDAELLAALDDGNVGGALRVALEGFAVLFVRVDVLLIRERPRLDVVFRVRLVANVGAARDV
jgi:hypothetical protein